ncbi:hypothetical protein B0H12DRAFT_1229102 [Mycena haematopus]|nr:hypothetical protein B0H12DRAFT_1229102 [Mycena haematopus]
MTFVAATWRRRLLIDFSIEYRVHPPHASPTSASGFIPPPRPSAPLDLPHPQVHALTRHLQDLPAPPTPQTPSLCVHKATSSPRLLRWDFLRFSREIQLASIPSFASSSSSSSTSTTFSSYNLRPKRARDTGEKAYIKSSSDSHHGDDTSAPRCSSDSPPSSCVCSPCVKIVVDSFISLRPDVIHSIKRASVSSRRPDPPDGGGAYAGAEAFLPRRWWYRGRREHPRVSWGGTKARMWVSFQPGECCFRFFSIQNS